MKNESAENRTMREAYWDSLANDPARQWTPVEIQRDAPAGFEIAFDVYAETIVLFGPLGAHGVQVKALTPWGGTFRVTGEGLLQAYVDVCGLGTARDPHTRARALRARLGGLSDFQVPEHASAPTREALDQFIANDADCQRATPAFISAVNSVARPVTDADLQDFIQRATHDPASAILHYETLRNGRLGLAPAIEKPPRAKRTAQPHPSPVGKEFNHEDH